MKLKSRAAKSAVTHKPTVASIFNSSILVHAGFDNKGLNAAIAGGTILLSACFNGQPVNAQGFASPNLAPINLVQNFRSDPVVNPTVIPTDVTPIPIGQERELIRPGYRFYLMQKLPRRLWFNMTCETSQRFESNVFFTSRDPKRDYVFRVLPNVSLGYNFLPHTSFYWNYFVIKDVFANHGHLSIPTTQSVSGGLRHEIPVSNRTNIQFDYQIRELWQAQNLRQADMIPAVTATHVFTPRCIGFANIQLQMRSKNIFEGATREIDPFYTVGMLYRWKQWTFSATDTFVTNYRNSNAIPPQGNLAMIADFEVNRPLSKKLPGVVGFIRAEPIWNWESNQLPGISGFDFRLFSGIRIAVSKPSYYADFSKLRQQIQGADGGSKPNTQKQTAPANQSTPGSSSSPSSGSGQGSSGSGNAPGTASPGTGNTSDPNSNGAGNDKPPDTLLPLPPSGLNPEGDGSAGGGIGQAPFESQSDVKTVSQASIETVSE